MRERLQRRLQELEQEFAAGQKQLAQLEEQANTLRTTLLRISGAIQVLSEELTQAEQPNGHLLERGVDPGQTAQQPLA